MPSKTHRGGRARETPTPKALRRDRVEQPETTEPIEPIGPIKGAATHLSPHPRRRNRPPPDRDHLTAACATQAWNTWRPALKGSYCWGAWQQDSGPALLSDEGSDGEGNRSRTYTETTPTGTCTLTIRSTHTTCLVTESRQAAEVELT